MIRIECSRKPTKTDIFIGAGLLKERIQGRILDIKNPFVLILDKNVDTVSLEWLQDHALLVLLVEGGEAVKCRSVLEKLQDQMLAKGVEAETTVVACGGGATLDVAGFLAATYYRGLPLCLVPSTLLAMTDAGIGGKNGINVGKMKNSIGTIYHPQTVYIDIDFLKSLPTKEFNNGLVEMCKHALLDSVKSCERFEKNVAALRAQEPKLLLSEIVASLQVKKRYVEASCEHPQIRHVLNLGHTIGHAIESIEDFHCSHGEAVAMGLLAEGMMAKRLGFLEDSAFERLKGLLHSLQLPNPLTHPHSHEEWRQRLLRDKKTSAGKPRFVLLKEPGLVVEQEGEYTVQVPESILFETIDLIQR